MLSRISWIFCCYLLIVKSIDVQGKTIGLRQRTLETVAITCADGASFQRDAYDCTAYYQCLSTTTLSAVLHCGTGLVFNQIAGYCDYPANVNDCPVSTPSAPPATAPVVAPTSAPVAAPVTAPVVAPTSAPVSQPVSDISKSKYEKGCYYTNWAQYRSDKYKYLPDDIDPSLCTTIYYAFAKIDANYDLTPWEWNDVPVEGDATGNYNRVLKWKELYPNLKVLLSVGGWTFNDCSDVNGNCTMFSDLAASSEHRHHFIENAGTKLRNWGFDGLDIDWEFPAYPGRNGINRSTPQDKANLVLLVKEFRKYAYDESLYSNKPRLLLTLAVGIGPKTVADGYDIPALCSEAYGADHINLMTYDFHGDWETITGHNTPLYETSDDIAHFGEGLSVEKAVNLWLQEGCPPKKLVVGLGTYGRGFTLADSTQHGFFAQAPASSPPGVIVPAVRGFYGYSEIMDMIQAGVLTEVWDDARGVPYAYNDKIWVGFDNVRSIRLKSEFVKSKGLKGAMLWTLDFDEFQSKKYPLLRTMNDVLFDTLTPEEEKSEETTMTEIIPEFPEGVWTYNDCSFQTLRRLPAKCAAALTSQSTEAEKLSCMLVKQPYTTGIFPFGIYPLDLPLDTPIQDINDGKLTVPFGDCVIPQMIADGCFSFKRDIGRGHSRFETYANNKQRLFSYANSNLGSHELKAKIHQITVTGGWVGGSSSDTSGSSNERSSGAHRSWSNEIGILSMDTCMRSHEWVKAHLLSSFVSDWNRVFAYGAITDDFKRVIKSGLYMPTSFRFSVDFGSKIESTYVYEDESSEGSVTTGYILGLDLGEASMAYTHKATEKVLGGSSQSSLFSKIEGKDIKYGDCRFDRLMVHPNHMPDTLGTCANEVQQVEKLRRVTSVAPGGFISVYDMIGFDTRGYRYGIEHFHLHFLKLYTSECTCDSDHSYKCVDPDNNVMFSAITYTACDVAPWAYWKPLPLKEPPAFSVIKTTEANPIAEFVPSGGRYFGLVSPTRRFSIHYQVDANFVKYDGNSVPVFASNTVNRFGVLTFDGSTGSLYIKMNDGASIVYILTCDKSLSPYYLMIDDIGVVKSYSASTGSVCGKF